ncbi:phosphotriesterase family protein [Georgenia sp. Z1491]|uniref:phosphotriesterase family protein n=1 Tax=Georgenia sp. Z1491 TaxID=3416707 RepID=UPI003CF0A221
MPGTTTIRTVSGPVAASAVAGPVLAHEHLALDLRTGDDAEGFLAHEDAVTAELARAADAHGLALVVDQTARGMGRDVAVLARISAGSGVDVVAATGWYYARFHPDGEPGDDVGRATDLLLADLLEGIDGTGIRAGVVAEIGTHAEEPTPAESIGLRASARAACRADVSLATHAHLGTGARAQLDLLLREGLDPARIAIGHQDLSADEDQQDELLAAGCYLSFDTVGKESYRPDDARRARILALVESGYGGRLLLSNDISRHAYLASEGGQGYGHVLGPFADSLRSLGLEIDDIDRLYRRNALRWLTGVGTR